MNDFDRLVEAQIPRLRRYARALTRDLTRADDLVQSCLTRAIAKQHLWQPGTEVRAWLFTIMHNQHVNEIRRSVREGANVPIEDAAPVLTIQSNALAALRLRDLERAWANWHRNSARSSCSSGWRGCATRRLHRFSMSRLGRCARACGGVASRCGC
jgi:DNA-directed RNA polymerase specialized sigma24 family protein